MLWKWILKKTGKWQSRKSEINCNKTHPKRDKNNKRFEEMGKETEFRPPRPVPRSSQNRNDAAKNLWANFWNHGRVHFLTARRSNGRKAIEKVIFTHIFYLEILTSSSTLILDSGFKHFRKYLRTLNSISYLERK